MSRRRISLGAALALELCAVGEAAAHGSPPEVTQISMREPNDALVVTTRGLLFGDPRAHRWSLLCSEAFGVAVGGSYRAARLPSGRLFVSNARGLRVSDDEGCSWQPHPDLGALDITDLFQEATRPERLYVTVFDQERGGIQESNDGGETFRPLYHADASEFVNSVEVARSGPSWLYATLLTTDDVPRMFVLRSRDGGATWSRTELFGAEALIDVSVLGVNPANPRELFLRTRYIDARNGQGLLQSRDGGESFTLLGKYGPVSNVTFTEDGTSFVVAAGKVMQSSTVARIAAPLAAIDGMTYGGLFDQQLLLSGYRVLDDRLKVMVWSSDIASMSPLREWMSFGEVTSLQACPASSTVSEQCARDWLDWSTDFLASPSEAAP